MPPPMALQRVRRKLQFISTRNCNKTCLPRNGHGTYVAQPIAVSLVDSGSAVHECRDCTLDAHRADLYMGLSAGLHADAAGADADGQADMEEGGDEIDPLDAFMAENDGAAAAAIGAAEQAAAPDDEEDDVDPLDAFMAAEVMPAVKQEPGSVPAAAPGVEKEQLRAAVPKAEAPAALPVGVKPEAANGVAGAAAADGAALGAVPTADKPPVVKRRARRRYADSDESSDDEPESASEDDEVCSRFSPFTRVGLTWRPSARACCSTSADHADAFCLYACLHPS